MPKLKFILSSQMIAFCDCVWSTYEVFSNSVTFFASTHFNGIFQSDEKLIHVAIPGPNDGVEKTFVWTVSILTLIISIVWVDSSLQLLIGTRQLCEASPKDISRCRYWLHLSFLLLFLFAFKTYSNTGYISAFILSCLALFYRAIVIFAVHEDIQEMEKDVNLSLAQPPHHHHHHHHHHHQHRVHFMDSEHEELCQST